MGRQLTDTLACNADLLLAVVDGERPRCRAPVAHCDVHHLDGDPTNHAVDNLAGLCRRHHRRLHSTFWHPHLDGRTGRFDLLRSPTGQPVHTTYPRGTHPRRRTPTEVG